MATMLSAIATDVAIDQPLLQQALNAAVNVSFNRISIDGDTSTNDTVLVLANGVADNARIADPAGADYTMFTAALADLCTELAQAIVRDGGSDQVRQHPRQQRAHRRRRASHRQRHRPPARWSRPRSTATPTGAASWRAGPQRGHQPTAVHLHVDGGQAGARLGTLQLVDGGTYPCTPRVTPRPALPPRRST
ncbi:MAG: bifunctional ornithine acetyltransferase/N-acetylglutamate synthase [Caldilineaceae bacterium]